MYLIMFMVSTIMFLYNNISVSQYLNDSRKPPQGEEDN